MAYLAPGSNYSSAGLWQVHRLRWNAFADWSSDSDPYHRATGHCSRKATVC